MNKTKKINKYLPLIITISLVLMIGVTFAWLSFRASKQSDLSVTKVALNVTFDMEDSLSGVATGDTIVDSITFSPVANAGDCYVRAQVAFDTQNAPSDDDKRYLLAINYQDVDTHSTAGYQWVKGSDGYYYLTDSTGDMLAVSNSDSAYTFCEDVTFYSPTCFQGTVPVPTDLKLNAKVQAVQTKNITDTSLSAIEEIFAEAFGKDPSYGYIVMFDTGEGSKVIAQTFLSSGQKVTQPTDPVLLGQFFKGWYTDAEFTTPYDFNSSVENNVTLYAKFGGVYETGQYTEGDYAGKYYIEMGTYPQTLLTDANIKANLALVQGETYTLEDTTGARAECPVYQYGGDKYVQFNMTESNTYSSNYTNFTQLQGVQYYKIEPVRWIVIGDGDGNALPGDFNIETTTLDSITVVSEKILVQQIFDPFDGGVHSETGSVNEWKNSPIRTFMNGALLNDLFTETEISYIQDTDLLTTYVSNSGNVTTLASTGDKLFTLAVMKQNDVEYDDNYTVNMFNENNTVEYGGTYGTLKAKATDLATAIGVYTTIYAKCGYWWLRSGYYFDISYACYVNADSRVVYNAVSNDQIGVRAAFVLSL